MHAVEDATKYPMLAQYTTKVKKMERPLVGREKEVQSVLAAMMRPELCNVMLLGEPGSGKTALVQCLMERDPNGRLYLEVDLAKMIAGLSSDNDLAAMLKAMFDETAAYCKEEESQIVLFIDEFHQIVSLSKAAVEALKPLLADSGTRGVRVIAATTFREFREFISPNQPLVERLQRINLGESDKKMTVEILRGMAKRYGIENQFYNDNLYEAIYDYTNRYIPANSQPRKSLLILDAMIGWQRASGRPLDRKLLADVIYESEGVNIAFRVDARQIRKRLNDKVIAQEFATDMIERWLHICVADMNKKDKPMCTFLFTGSTGVGKTQMTKELAAILYNDSRSLIRFDMTEFSDRKSLERFRVELSSRVWEKPYSIILLDEIEKACAEVTRLLLPVLDDGRLIDQNNREVTFTNSYIVMTTNAGSEIYRDISQYAADDTGSGEKMKEYDTAIRTSLTDTTGGMKFPVELVNRIDCIVPFQPLSENTLRQIVTRELYGLIDLVKQERNVALTIDKRVVRYITDDNLSTDSNAGGARSAIRKVQTEVAAKVAEFVNLHPEIAKVHVQVEGTLASEDKHQLKSSARVVVMAKQGTNIAKKRKRK